MGEEDKKPENTPEPQSGFPQKKIIYAVIAVAVVILAVVLVAKFGYNTDLLNPAGGQMSLVQRPATLVRANVTISEQQPRLEITPAVQRVTTGVVRLSPCAVNQSDDCNGACVYLQTDPNNCGSCGKACSVYPSTVPVCSGGKCIFTCSAGHGDCNHITADGCEVNLNENANSCGQCGYGCKSGESCINGKCGFTGDTKTDVNNCGKIGNVCPSGQNAKPGCYQGTCTQTCNDNFRNCGTSEKANCVSMNNDPNYCGSCGKKCYSGETCEGGKCIPPTCVGIGLSACKGQCVNYQNDPKNCGGCGNDCRTDGGTVECSWGTCFLKSCYTDPVYWKVDNFVKCHPTDTTCTNVETDEHNCGECGKVCPSDYPYCYDNWCNSQPEVIDLAAQLPHGWGYG